MRKTFMLFFAALLAYCFYPLPTPAIVSAESVYTSPLSDLKNDLTFDEREYPADETDYSLSVITIAESNSGELFVYAYQPSGEKVTASSINISPVSSKNLALNDDGLRYRNYRLRLVSSEGVFFKYVVYGYSVKGDKVRYYDIPSVFRLFDSDFDTNDKATIENFVSEVAYEVGYLWTFVTNNGKLNVSKESIKVIRVTDKVDGSSRYSNGFLLNGISDCYSYYVAFSTDIPIGDLLEADVGFSCRLVTHSYIASIFGGDSRDYSDWTEGVAYLDNTQTGSNDPVGWFGYKYLWNRILTVNDFNAQTERYGGTILNKEAHALLNKQQWVLQYAEFPYSRTYYSSGVGGYYEEYYEVGYETILRLKFVTAGKTYNLGVVDNKTVPPKTATYEYAPKITVDNFFDDIYATLKKIVGILLLAAAVTAGIIILPHVIRAFGYMKKDKGDKK